MFPKIWKNLKGKSRGFAAALVLGMVLCSCSSGAGKSVVLEDVPSGKGQEQSGREEAIAPTEGAEMREDAEGLEGISGVVDEEQNEPEESGEIPMQEAGVQGDFGVSDDVSGRMEKGQEQEEKRQGKEEPGTEQGQPMGEQADEQVTTWQSAYLEVIYHLWDYLAPRYDPLSGKDSREEYDNPMDIDIFFFGLHDFDGDGILELVTGDGNGVAVFTYEDGCAKKIADLCNPDKFMNSYIDAVYFKDNCINAAGSGSGGCEYINFGYLEGEYVLGHYNQLTPAVPITINGREGTVEEMEKIYTLDFDKREEGEQRERFRLVNENGVWILKHYESDEESVLDMSFDFDSVLW